MAERPWVTPEEVKIYSSESIVQRRTTEQLQFDISRAESLILAYTRNKSLLDDEAYPTIPEAIKTATILLAEHYGVTAVNKGYTSESFDDYSYSKDASATVDVSSLGLGYLLDEFIVSGSVTLDICIV